MPGMQDNNGRKVTVTRDGKVSKYSKRKFGVVGATVSIPPDGGDNLVATVNAVLDAGDAIMLARTSGGGILAVTVYSQGCDPEKFYAKDDQELYAILADIEQAAKGQNAR